MLADRFQIGIHPERVIAVAQLVIWVVVECKVAPRLVSLAQTERGNVHVAILLDALRVVLNEDPSSEIARMRSPRTGVGVALANVRVQRHSLAFQMPSSNPKTPDRFGDEVRCSGSAGRF